MLVFNLTSFCPVTETFYAVINMEANSSTCTEGGTYQMISNSYSDLFSRVWNSWETQKYLQLLVFMCSFSLPLSSTSCSYIHNT